MLPDSLPIALTFDDVLLAPGPGDILPGQTDLSVALTPTLKLAIPIITSAMDSVTESAMAIAIGRLGGLGVIHRNLDPTTQADEVRRTKAESVLCGAAVGAGPEADDRAARLTDAGVDALFVDTAHGHSARVLRTVEGLASRYAVPVIAGNVATAHGARALADAGAAGIKVGVGPGSICTTRIVAGVGVPQLTAVAEAARGVAGRDVVIIADGGIRASGDVVKAIAGGAHAVMIGSLFAGTDPAPGEKFERGGMVYKSYRGMGSLGAMESGSGSKDRYGQHGVSEARKLVPEGVEARVAYRGALDDVVYQLLGGLRAGMGYVGAADLAALRAYDRFVRITAAGWRESHVHDVHMTADAPNYRR
ncbi:MAG: guanosine monophosphate reductase [Deltaproteobacteria bacterium]|nr:MAG: guanosine monophosphate reductase [Deltaproteobacteria bacterium]